jgi:hypothetical protein
MKAMEMRSVSVFCQGQPRSPVLSQRLSIGIGQSLIALMAPLVVLTHVAQVSAWPFRTYAPLACAWTVLVVGWVARRIWQRRSFSGADVGCIDGATLTILLIASAASSSLALLGKVPSRDDYYYAPNPVHYLAHPGEAMGFSVHGLLSNTSELFASFHWSTAIAFEYVQAAWAYGINSHFLTVYHILTPTILAALVPWILYGLFCVWRPAAMETAFAVVATLLVLLCMGDTLRAPGNYFLLRLYQGKTVGFALGIPLFITFVCRYLSHASVPAWRNEDWWCVSGLAICTVGTTTPSVVIYPPLAVALVVAHYWSAGNSHRFRETRFWRPVVGLMAAHSYLIGYGLVLWAFSSDLGDLDNAINQGWPRDFSGHAQFFWNPEFPVTPLVLSLATAISLWASSPAIRRFLVAWWAVTLLVFLNPWFGPLWIKYVTTPNIYWRWFYLLPLLPSLGLAWFAFFHSLFRGRRKTQWVLGGSVLTLVAVGVFVSPSSALRRITSVGLFEYRIFPGLEHTASQLIQASPPGPMLASKRFSGVIPMLSADRPQMRLRNDGVRQWLGQRGAKGDAELRIQASDFVNGTHPYEDAFRRVVEQYPNLKTLVLHRSVELRGDTRLLLRELGFTQERTVGTHQLLWKPTR